MADIEFLDNEAEAAPLARPKGQTYSETVRWLVRNGYFKAELPAKIFLITLSVIFFALSFVLVYVASTYVQTDTSINSIDFQQAGR